LVPCLCLALVNTLSGVSLKESTSLSSEMQTQVPGPMECMNLCETLFPEYRRPVPSIAYAYQYSLAGSPQSFSLPSSPLATPLKSRDASSAADTSSEALWSTATEILKLLQHISIITSFRDTQILSFLVCILYASAKKRSVLPEVYNFSTKCQNCENSVAHFECSHQSCITEGCFCLCASCDTVLHKAIVRRSHFRFPINVGGSLRPAMQLIDPQLHSVVRTALVSGCCDPSSGFGPICILLSAIRGILDDRRSKEQSIPGTLLEPVLIAQRSLLVISMFGSTSSTKGLRPEYLSSLARLADHRDDINVSAGEVVAMDEPPEASCLGLPRIAVTLFLQVVARFFIVDTLKSVDWTGLVCILDLYRSRFHHPYPMSCRRFIAL
jgi:hypothetical protein